MCNAVETLLVHRDCAAEFLPGTVARLRAQGVELRVDRAGLGLLGDAAEGVGEATDADYGTEFLGLVLAVRSWTPWTTPSTTSSATAPATARRSSPGRSTRPGASRAPWTRPPSTSTPPPGSRTAASSGMGAEIGISTQKLHARGPIGLAELTTYKYLVTGDGHVR